MADLAEHPRADAPPADDEAGARGHLEIADRVVQKVASFAAREIDDVVVPSSGLPGMLGGSRLPKAEAVIAGGHARIGLEIVIAWPKSAASVAGEVRERVRERVTTIVGIQVDAVDVTVTEVVRVASTRRRVQ